MVSPGRKKRARKRKNLDLYDQEFSDQPRIFEDVENIKKQLMPLKELMKNMENQTRDMINVKCLITKLDEKIKEQNKKFDSLREKVNSIDINRPANTAQTANEGNNENFVDELANEVKWRISLENQIRITNAKDENEIRQIFSQIMERQANITKIVKMNDENSDLPPAYMVEMSNESEKKEIMNKKYQFFKDKGLTIGLHPARTINQRKIHKEKMEKKKNRQRDNNENENNNATPANEVAVNSSIPRKNKCRNGVFCEYKKNCRFWHPPGTIFKKKDNGPENREAQGIQFYNATANSTNEQSISTTQERSIDYALNNMFKTPNTKQNNAEVFTYPPDMENVHYDFPPHTVLNPVIPPNFVSKMPSVSPKYHAQPENRVKNPSFDKKALERFDKLVAEESDEYAL